MYSAPLVDDGFRAVLGSATHHRVAARRLPLDVADPLARGAPDSLTMAAQWVLPEDADSELLPVVDQLEELFTLVDDEALRSRFIECLVAAVGDQGSRVRVAATLRADFYDRPLQYPGLAELIDTGTQVVPPLTADELERAIAGPAQAVGVDVEPGLRARIAADVVNQPGALPLLQYALTQLFERRSTDTLQLATYDQIGGVSAALARRAEEIFAALPRDARSATRDLFLRLVTPGDGVEDTRRRVLRSELLSLQHPGEAMAAAIDAFGDARLLSFDRDPANREPTVEVAHEALLRTWPQLSGWLAEDQEKLRLLDSIHRAAEEWEGGGRPADLLVHRDGRLKDAEALITNRRFALPESSLEKRYLDACTEAQHAREAAEREEQERRVRDAERIAEEQKKAAAAQKKTAQRTAVGLAVAVAFAVLAGWQWYEATNQRTIAERRAFEATDAKTLADQQAAEAEAARVEAGNQREAAVAEAKKAKAAERKALAQESRALAALAQSETRAGNAVNGMLLALRGMPIADAEEARPVVTETRQALVDATLARREVMVLPGHEGPVSAAGFSPDGAHIVSGSEDGTVRVWDLARREERLVLRGHQGPVHAAAFSPDGARIVSGSEDGTVRLWNAATGAELLVAGGHEGPVSAAGFSSDGARIVSGSEDGTVRVWDAADGEDLLALRDHRSGVTAAAFSPDGAWITSGADDRTVRAWVVGKDDAALVSHACTRLPRNLSPAAIERFNVDPDAPWPCAERAKTLWPHPMAAAVSSTTRSGKNAGAAAAQ